MSLDRHFGVVELRVDWGDPIDHELDSMATEEEKYQRNEEICYYLVPYELFLLGSDEGTSMFVPCPRSEILDEHQRKLDSE